MLANMMEQLATALDPPLVDALLKAHNEIKRQYYLGKHKPSELEGGHFAEVVIRILQHIVEGKYTPLDTSLARFDIKEVEKYSQLPRADFPDSIRIHIPRAILAIYGIRNRRGVGHVGGDVNPNLSDSTFIMTTCDWILTELISLYYTSSRAEAQSLVDSLIERKIPLVQDFDGYPKVLNPKLSVANKILVLLYFRGTDGASISELRHWITTKSSSHITTALAQLQHEKCYVHRDNSRCFITRTGIIFVEKNIPLYLVP